MILSRPIFWRQVPSSRQAISSRGKIAWAPTSHTSQSTISAASKSLRPAEYLSVEKFLKLIKDFLLGDDLVA
jgi:hypothetical protein